MVQCKECSYSCSDNAEKCPNCGSKIERISMKIHDPDYEYHPKKKGVKANIPLISVLLVIFGIFIWSFVRTNKGLEDETESNFAEEITQQTIAVEEETTKDIFSSWTSIALNVPSVTYDEVKTGKYNESYVVINAYVQNVENLNNFTFLDLWYESNEYGFVVDSGMISWEDLQDNYIEICSGDTIQFCTYVYSDSSFGLSKVKKIQVIKSNGSNEEMEELFKQRCLTMDYKSVLRTPDKYRNNNYVLTGSVLQVVSEENGYIDFLLDCGNDEIVWVNYKKEDFRILEDDNISIYGTFYFLYDYTSVLGVKKTVPKLTAFFLDFN